MVFKFIEKYKEELKGCINDLKDIKTFYKQIPNLLTFLRLVGAIPAGVMYYSNPYASIGLISFLWFTDVIDGKIARKFKIQSKLGADMDAFSDKIMFLSSSLPLMSFAPELIYNFVLEGVISLVNVTGRVKGLDTKTVLSGKIKTVFLALTLISGYLVQFFGMPISILTVLMSFTTGFQFIAIKDYIVEFIKMDKERKEKDVNNDEIRIVKENDMINQDVYDKTMALDKDKNLLDELRKEREFYSGVTEPGVVKVNVRSRNIKGEKKNGNFIN